LLLEKEQDSGHRLKTDMSKRGNEFKRRYKKGGN